MQAEKKASPLSSHREPVIEQGSRSFVGNRGKSAGREKDRHKKERIGIDLRGHSRRRDTWPGRGMKRITLE